MWLDLHIFIYNSGISAHGSHIKSTTCHLLPCYLQQRRSSAATLHSLRQHFKKQSPDFKGRPTCMLLKKATRECCKKKKKRKVRENITRWCRGPLSHSLVALWSRECKEFTVRGGGRKGCVLALHLLLCRWWDVRHTFSHKHTHSQQEVFELCSHTYSYTQIHTLELDCRLT